MDGRIDEGRMDGAGSAALARDGVVIVGAGEAGARAAGALREAGFAGPVTLVGEEPHGPYERPPLSKAVMTDTAEPVPPTILDAAGLAARGISHLAAVRATGLDRGARRLLLEGGRSLPYGRLLLATGAGPRRLAVPGAEAVLSLRTFADALGLRARLRPGAELVVIGGGFIGLEVAASAIARGCAVTLLEAAPRILMRGVPAAVAARVAAAHAGAGVVLRTGVGLLAVERRGAGVAVHLSDGTHLLADAAVAGIGAVPETGLAEAAGLAIDNGIKVDARLCTDDPDIFAAGDCCSFPHPLYGGRRIRLEAWRNAQGQGALAARNLLGGAQAYDAVPWFWSDQYADTLQVAGLADEGVATVERPLGSGALFFHLAADGRLVATSAIGPNAAIARDVRLAERLIATRARPNKEKLQNPHITLKSLIAA